MQGTDSTIQAKGYAYLTYVGHIAVMTGKTREPKNLDGLDTISDVITRLDKKYPGFKEIFMPPGGIFNSRTGINLRRVNQATFGISNEDERIEVGDILTFW